MLPPRNVCNDAGSIEQAGKPAYTAQDLGSGDHSGVHPARGDLRQKLTAVNGQIWPRWRV
jgi:hypothetical protein